VIVLNIKIGYYPVLDMALAFRQLYCGERFKPYIGSLDNIYNKMTEEEKEFIYSFGEATTGWLEVLEKLIDVTLHSTASVEEIILNITKSPELLIKNQKSNVNIKEVSENFKKLYQNHFNSEIAKNNKNIFDKVIEISDKIDEQQAVNYLLSISDRIEKEDENTLKFFIKPDHKVNIDEITNIIIMPSIFASRNLTFWYNGTDYLFYISINSFEYQPIEPSDMILLKTLALNDRTRLKMLKILSTGNYSTADIAEKLNINSSTISRHFKLFKDAGFVDIFSQEGNSIYYSLNVKEIEQSFKVIFNYIKEEEV
jgi:DNA-binding transcriptional ArsR family regulator